ncbi:ABC transporter permease [Hyalangium versicolor]|uniref:ABC transporter permease n=1 Tax=Hyalangium versicolor TaxID=2861190 RepID=UPI001CCDF0A2|nr:ABC transporter permease [Hyalangium versicolor]
MNSQHPLWQLVLFRMRGFLREPAALFWVFAFPLLTSLALGLAFRNRALPELAVAVVESPDADRLVPALEAVDGLTARQMSEAEGRDALRRGRVALVLIPSSQPELITDPMQSDGRTARLMVVDALERLNGRADHVSVRNQQVTAPGSRYIDFLIPGLLGFALMSSSLWGLGFALVEMRTGKLLKRLVATPMKRTQFLLSFMIGRSMLAVAEILFFVVFSRVFFDVRMFGNLLSFIVLGLWGAMSFAGFSLFICSRATTSQTASGLMNLTSMPMTVLSGVFFSASNFPDWFQPVIQFLPLTALNDGLRAIMLDGTSLLALWPQVLILGVWGLIPFVIAVRYFKWM